MRDSLGRVPMLLREHEDIVVAQMLKRIRPLRTRRSLKTLLGFQDFSSHTASTPSYARRCYSLAD